MNKTRYETMIRQHEHKHIEVESDAELIAVILEDISETLALIYDCMKGDSNDEA